jgi:HAD superfamily hydrolase (TIGR01490 family)
MNQKHKAALFDLDFTYVNQNSFFDFVQYYLFQQKRFGRLFRYWLFVFFEKFGLSFLYKSSKRALCLSLLVGATAAEIRTIAKRYALERLTRYINDDLAAKFQIHRAAGDKTILISASISEIVEEFGEYIGFDYAVGSRLQFDQGGKFNGELQLDLLGNKRGYIYTWLTEQQLDVDFDRSSIYLDDQPDLDFLQLVNDPHAVVTDPLQEEFWVQHNIPVLYIRPKFSWDRRLLYLPTAYYFYARYPAKELIFRYIPYFLFNYYWFSADQGSWGLVAVFFAWLGFMTLYEIGYLVNDCLAAARETKGSLRIDRQTCLWLPRYRGVKIATFVLIVGILAAMLPFRQLNLYLLACFVTSGLFYFHNKIDRPYRIVTFPGMKILRLITPVLIFPLDLSLVLIGALIFYLPTELFYYWRKITGKGDWSKSLRFELALVKFTVWIFVLFFYYFGENPVYQYLVWVGAILSLVEIGLIMKWVAKFVLK